MTVTASIHLTRRSAIKWHDDRDGGYLTVDIDGDAANLLYLFTGDIHPELDRRAESRRQWEAIAEAARVALAELTPYAPRAEDDPTETDEPTDEPAHPWAVAPGRPAEWVRTRHDGPGADLSTPYSPGWGPAGALPPTEARAADGDR